MRSADGARLQTVTVRRDIPPVLRLVLLSSLALACGPAGEDAARAPNASDSSRTHAAKTRFTDEGKVCLAIDTKVAPPSATDRHGATFLIAGAPLVVTVHPPQHVPVSACLQTGSSCQVRLDGATLQIRSQLRFDLAGAVDCIATSTAAVVCDGPALADGQYVLQHGSARSAFEVPLTTPLPFCNSPR